MGKLRRLKEIAEKYDTTEDKIIAFTETNPQVTFYFAEEEILMDFLVDVSTKLEKHMGSPMQLNNIEKPEEFLKEFEKRRKEQKKEGQEK
jgi:hypothetical protein